jgi:Zn-dependent membrane protease YugP
MRWQQLTRYLRATSLTYAAALAVLLLLLLLMMMMTD